MKKKLMLLSFIISFVLFMGSVNATSSYTCTKEVAPNENVLCTIKIDTDPVLIESDGNINISSITGSKYSKVGETKVIFYESGTVKFGPVLDKYSKYIFSLYNETGTEKYSDDIRVAVIAKTTTTKKTTTSTTTTTTAKKSDNNYLSSIIINNEKIDDFDKEVDKYYKEVENDVEEITISANPEDALASISVNGPKTLNVGDNEYTIKVTAEDDTARYYKIIVTRKEELSSNTKLKSIDIKGYDFKIDGNSITYHLTIKENVSKLDISVVTNDDKATYEIVGNEKLKDGSEIKINVTAENNEKASYRIIINKEKEKNSILPFILIGSLILIIIIVIIVIVMRKKKNNKDKENDNNTKEFTKDEKEEIDNDEEEKTKVMEPISISEDEF